MTPTSDTISSSPVSAAHDGPSPELRAWLTAVADVMIPATSTMPAASDVGVSEHQLDVVLAARPDLAETLQRAWKLVNQVAPENVLSTLDEQDGECFDAVRIVVAGGYYVHPEVRRLLGYHGQEPRVVRVDVVPEYIEEGLLERVMERGPIFRNDH